MYKNFRVFLQPPSICSGTWFVSLANTAKKLSLMDLVNDCDRYANSVVTIPQLTISSFPYFQDDSESYTRMANPYYHLRVSSVPATLGYVVDSIRKVPNWIVDDKSTPQTLTFSAGYDEPPCLAIVGRRQRQCAALVPSRF